MLKHHISFDSIEDFDWSTAVIFDRTRPLEGEARSAAVGWLYNRLHTVIYTLRGETVRIISLRRANKPEEKSYDQNSEE